LCQPVGQQCLQVGRHVERVLVDMGEERLGLHVADVLGDERLGRFQLGRAGLGVAGLGGLRERLRQARVERAEQAIELAQALFDLADERRRGVRATGPRRPPGPGWEAGGRAAGSSSALPA
jgi:hypothetical protein